MINVAVIDDEALMRSGLTMILEGARDLSVTVATCGRDAVDKIRVVDVDVVLLSLQMPDRSGMDVLIELQSWDSPPAVAMVTTSNSEVDVSTALAAGASGFIGKDTDPRLLTSMVRTLGDGGIVLSSELSRGLFGGWALERVNARQKMESLSPRERDVLRHLRSGAPNEEVAHRLFLSTSTVKGHVSSILRKLNVATRLQAAIVAERGDLSC